MEYITFHNGVQMPALGYGIFQISTDICEQCVLDAVSVGYRAFDTAQSYGNEECLGSALKKAGIPRQELFLTTKVRPVYYGCTKQSVLESLEKLQTDYIDLVLLHQPFGDVYAAYRDLEDLYRAGVLRAIGVSNFYADRLVDLAYFAKIRPMVDQIEIHPLHQRPDLLEWGNKLGIAMQAWSPFGRGRGQMFDHPMLTEIGQKYQKTTAQVMLRWNLQRGAAVVQKTTARERMAQNIDIFDFRLTEADMDAIALLETGTSVFYSHADPATVEKFAQGILKSRT